MREALGRSVFFYYSDELGEMVLERTQAGTVRSWDALFGVVADTQDQAVADALDFAGLSSAVVAVFRYWPATLH